MQPTPPKSKKPGYRRPFYDAGKKTSAEIVSEARNTMKVLETSRPYTPIETNRRLFGNATRSSEGRPPSAFSIGPGTFTDPLVRSASRPPTGKLSPLRQIPTGISSDINPVTPDMMTFTRQSADTLPLEAHDKGKKFPTPPKSSKEPDVSKPSSSSYRQNVLERRAQSGPKEHTNQRKSSQFKNFRKSNSFSTMDRDIVSADSGVVRDITSADSIGHVDKSLSSSNEIFDEYKGSYSSSMSSDVNSSQNSETESRLGSSQGENDDQSDKVQDCILNTATSDSNSDSQSLLFKDNVEPLLRQMELNYLHSDIEALSVNFDVLWKALELCGLLVKASGSGSARRRTTVLRTIFKFVDIESPIVVLKLCKVALKMRVTGKNLVNICKLIFKISKDKTKDSLFKENDLIADIMEIIKTSDISSLCEGIIYATGSIKFLALNTLLHDDLLNADCASCFFDLLSNIKSLTVDANKSIHLSHLIVQASAAIRNIADLPNIRVSFINSGLVQILMELLQHFWKDADYMLNVSRILSKLTQYTDCCTIIGKDATGLGILLQAMQFHHKRQDIVVRLAFVLGNVAAKEIVSRRELYFKHTSLNVLLAILNEYFEFVQRTSSGEDGTKEDKIEKSNDVLVKVVRVLANMAIDQSVAADITNNNEFVSIIINLLQNHTKGDTVEELLINTAAMLNNLSFYASEESIFTAKSKELTEALLHLLFIDNMECIIEATRVFGNFTRFKEIRILLREKKVVHMLITLLESTEREVVFCACGTLINLMVDNQNRQILYDENGIRKLIDALRDFGQTDWQLSSMICQTLWNYSEKITSAISCFGDEETEDLIQILQDYTDPQVAFDYRLNPEIDPETIELMKQIWHEQFENVGIGLLNRIQFYHTELEPLVEDPH